MVSFQGIVECLCGCRYCSMQLSRGGDSLRASDIAYGRNNSGYRSEEHTSELQSLTNLVCRLLLEKKKAVRQTDSPGESAVLGVFVRRPGESIRARRGRSAAAHGAPGSGAVRCRRVVSSLDDARCA